MTTYQVHLTITPTTKNYEGEALCLPQGRQWGIKAPKLVTHQAELVTCRKCVALLATQPSLAQTALEALA